MESNNLNLNSGTINLVETQITPEVYVGEPDEDFFVEVSFGLAKKVKVLASEVRRCANNADVVQLAAQRCGLVVPDNVIIVKKGDNGGVVAGEAEPPMENTHLSIASSSGKGGAAI